MSKDKQPNHSSRIEQIAEDVSLQIFNSTSVHRLLENFSYEFGSRLVQAVLIEVQNAVRDRENATYYPMVDSYHIMSMFNKRACHLVPHGGLTPFHDEIKFNPPSTGFGNT